MLIFLSTVEVKKRCYPISYIGNGYSKCVSDIPNVMQKGCEKELMII